MGCLTALSAATPLFATGSPAQQLFCHGRNCTSGTTALRWGVHSPGRVSVYEESRATPPASTWIANFAPDGR